LMFDAEAKLGRALWEVMDAVVAQGSLTTLVAFGAALGGEVEIAGERLERALSADLAPIRRPDGHVPAGLCYLALTATLIGDQAAGERLRTLLEPLRPYLIQAPPSLFFGNLPEWLIGRLELLAGRPETAVEELREAVEQADELNLVLTRAWARVDLASALHRCGATEEAQAALLDALRIRPRFPEALCTRGIALMQLRRREEALACFDQAIAILPDFVEALSSRATDSARGIEVSGPAQSMRMNSDAR